MQVRGGMLQRLGPGQVFYESPEDVHIVSRNANKTKPTLTRLPRFPFQWWQRHVHAEELGFRDFSSLFLVEENRRQLGNSACCISFMKVSLTSRVFAMG